MDAIAETAAYTPRPQTLIERARGAWRRFKNSRRISIREEDGTHKAWYEEARHKIKNPKQLAAFASRLLNTYNHDYGTICHAAAAVAVAGAWCVDGDYEQGGITGFQAGAIMLEFITHWQTIKGPMSLVKYEEMLYPQKSDDFANTITEYTWEWLKAEAVSKLAEMSGPKGPYHMEPHPQVVEHWKSIVAGVVPFGYTVQKNEEAPSKGK